MGQILNAYAPNNFKIHETKLIKLKGDVNKVIIIPLSIIHRASKQKVCKAIEDLNNTANKLNLINIYATFHPITAEFTFFSNAHGTGTKVIIWAIKQVCCPTTAEVNEKSIKDISENLTNMWKLALLLITHRSKKRSKGK